jgi:sterol-4alpha-carboxylate 3-dehydrogenase (decarboxylating)
MTGLYQVYERNQTHFQIGDNTNLFDWTYVGNVAHAHLLAADKLVSIPPLKEESDVDSLRTLTPEDEDLISYPLPSIDLTTGKHRIPTCQARPLGPYVTPPPNAQAIEAAFDTPNPPMSKRPVVRSPFDQFTPKAIVRRETNPLQVAGQAFFITNGEPVYFWDFPRAVWTLLDAHLPTKRPKKRLIVLPRAIGLAAATGAEWWGRLTGKEPTFTRYKVSYSCATRWHNIEKARRILGYEPQVGVEEGIARMVNVSKLLPLGSHCR